MRHHKQTGENGTQNEHGLYRTDTGRVVACDGGRTEDGIDSDVDVDSNDGRTSENGVLTRRGALKMGAAAVAAATGATAATGVGAAAPVGYADDGQSFHRGGMLAAVADGMCHGTVTRWPPRKSFSAAIASS